jgi:hypothetical protein
MRMTFLTFRPPIESQNIPEGDILQWHNLVHLCHDDRYLLPLVESYDSIEGLVCCNIQNVQEGTRYPQFKLKSYQSCVHSVSMAAKMTSWIVGLLILGKEDTLTDPSQ